MARAVSREGVRVPFSIRDIVGCVTPDLRASVVCESPRMTRLTRIAEGVCFIVPSG